MRHVWSWFLLSNRFNTLDRPAQSQAAQPSVIHRLVNFHVDELAVQDLGENVVGDADHVGSRCVVDVVIMRLSENLVNRIRNISHLGHSLVSNPKTVDTMRDVCNDQSMNSYIPSPDELRQVLANLTRQDLEKLSRLSGVPFGTLWKVRTGETPNPRVATVRAFWPYALRMAEEA